ncbi:MAG: hypothetical protein M1837_002131 [Sclerophora amabilis]|nr:MAG: hypothetical protein M1837_002131 [Sclerophora amabilis]
MSAPETLNKSNGRSSTPELDVPRLHALPSEQQDLYLLTFTADLVSFTRSLTAEEITAKQAHLKKELFQIITLSSPSPTRVIRNNLARCFATIFTLGNRKILYESINDLLGIINGSKGDKDLKAKHAATICLGAIFNVAGDSAISLSSLSCSSLIRLLKPAQNHAGFRSSIYKSLGKLLRMVGTSADESTFRDVWKSARNSASSDKAWIVQTAALSCLEDLSKSATHFDNSSDFENLKSTIFKAIDTSSRRVRHAGASCLATVLVKSYSEDAAKDVVPKIKKPKKTSTRDSMAPGDDEEIQRAESPAPKKSAVCLRLTLPDILRQISKHYTRSSTSNRVRAGLGICYTRVLKGLGATIVEGQYLAIAEHLLVDLLSSSSLVSHRYRLLTTRKFVKVILEDVVGGQILSQSSQLDCAKVLVNDFIRNYPHALAPKDSVEPSKHTLTGALSALASIINSLGSATYGIVEACRDGLLQVLQHSSYTVQVAASHCLQAYVLACPQQLLPCASVCMNSMSRELNLLSTPRHAPRRCVGFANGLAAVISTAPLQPLYSSLDISSRALTLATGLLKSSSNSELRISGTQIQVAWILIGGLLSLGPNFVKIHLSQFLLLWKNALPKPLTRENTEQRSLLELSFLTHVRECSLGSILAFLEFNRRLLTTDVSKRIAAMLQNTLLFLNGLPSKKTTEDFSQRLSPALQLQDFDLMVRRRVLQCYAKLVNFSPAGGTENLLQSNLLTLALTFFADPDNYSPNSLSSSIANSAGNFEGVWEIGDNCGFGVTGLVKGYMIEKLAGGEGSSVDHHWLKNIGPDAIIDETLLSPICGAREHDSVSLSTNAFGDSERLPDPPATEVVNSAIYLFAISLPLQPPKVQESILEQMATFLSSQSLQRDPGRRAAIIVNIATAILTTLEVAVGESSSTAGDLRGGAVEKIIQDMLRNFVIHPDQYIRNIAYEALGRLCTSSGNTFTSNEISYLVDTIVSNRDPNARAGCAVALGCIHSHVGGMAAGYHLKTILEVLMSLSNDPHPTVHFWALEGLTRVTDSAGLTFSGYVSSTLGLLARLYVVETHNEEVSTIASSNLELEMPTAAAIARSIDSLINVLGPDLQDMSKARDLMMTLVGQFQLEHEMLVQIEGIRSLEHLSMYASGYVDFISYVRRLQGDLVSPRIEQRKVAVDGLFNLMKRDAEDVIGAAEAGFEDQLWLSLDEDTGNKVLRNLIENWLIQTGLSDTNKWISRLQAVLNRTKSKVDQAPADSMTKSAGAPDLQDEEVAGFAATLGVSDGDSAAAPGVGQEPLKWQVRSFAMSRLSDLIDIVGKDSQTSEGNTQAESILQQRVADVIRMAFSASTSNVIELRLSGLRIIGQILKMFGKTPDPDFSEAFLLEQYQAQIGSALTPAFAADSSPELASEAINVCATFVAAGIVTDIDRMGRILKLLVSAVESFSNDSETPSIGDLRGLSSNAQVMVKMAVFSAWAQLQVASMEQKYLVEVVKPHIVTLTPLWLSSLREFARLRFEPDISMSTGPASASDSLEVIYSALSRETLLKFYQDSWLELVFAIASLIEQDTSFVFDALDGKSETVTTNGPSKGNDINYRDEPVAFFFVLFGIVFEALVEKPGNDSLATKEQILEVLLALKKILHPSVSGHAIYQDVIFSETMDLLDRLVLTEGLEIQAVIIDIARNLCSAHPSARDGHDPSTGEHLSEDIDQLFELTRIIVLVLAGLVPSLTESKTQARHRMSDEAVSLIRLSLDALVDAAEVFPSVIKTDLHACIFHIFATVLGTAACQTTVVPQALPILKRFIQGITRHGFADGSFTVIQIRNCLQRFLSILSAAKEQDTEASLPCVKNALLASTILLNGGTNTVPPNDTLLPQLVNQILSCLTDSSTSQVASNCTRSLLLLSSPKNPSDRAVARLLLPRLLSFVTSPSPEPSPASSTTDARPIIAHALTTFATTVLRPRHLSVPFIRLLVPTLLARASNLGPSIYRETAARLLEIASADGAAFREAVMVPAFGEEQRKFMEKVIRDGSGRGDDGGRTGGGKDGDRDDEGQAKGPSIALKMDFGTGQS